MTGESHDVVVVGAGAAGAAASWRLASHGLSVLCLEQGDWVDPRFSPSASEDWELIRQRRWHPNPNVRRSRADFPIDDSQSPIRPLMFNGVGGSTVMWSCHMPRFHARDFTMRTDDGVGDDWPIRLSQLEPYYALNERMMGVAGVSGNPAYAQAGEIHRTPPLPLGAIGNRLAHTFDRLGWSWWPADLAVHTGADTDDRRACNHCGPCELQCPRRAKASVDQRYWPPAQRLGAQLRTGARVARVETDQHNRVSAVRYLDGTRQMHQVRARAVVLAANGIGTPRLLLLSANARQPNGLANSSGLVGRRLMLHPLARVSARFADPMDGYRGITAGSFVSHHFYRTDSSRGFLRGVKLQALRTHGPALVAAGSLGQRTPWGRSHHTRFAQWFNQSFSLSICVDDLPNLKNHIALDANDVDSDGLPGVRMVYSLDNNSRRALDFGIARATEAMKVAGALETVSMPLVPDAGFHLMGTCKMGDDPRNAVLNEWGEAHDVPGLYVVDGSAFVTAAAVNPTNTLQALALRAADHLYRALSN